MQKIQPSIFPNHLSSWSHLWDHFKIISSCWLQGLESNPSCWLQSSLFLRHSPHCNVTPSENFKPVSHTFQREEVFANLMDIHLIITITGRRIMGLRWLKTSLDLYNAIAWYSVQYPWIEHWNILQAQNKTWRGACWGGPPTPWWRELVGTLSLKRCTWRWCIESRCRSLGLQLMTSCDLNAKPPLEPKSWNSPTWKMEIPLPTQLVQSTNLWSRR